MSGRRKSDEAPMSFFSFQDIIACTTGIMVLLTLVLTMELMSKTLDAADQDDPPSALAQALKQAKAKRDELNQRIKKGQKVLTNLAGGAIITKDQIDELIRIIALITKQTDAISKRIPPTKEQLAGTFAAANSTEKDIEGLKPEVADLIAFIEKLKKQPMVTVFDRSNDGKRPFWVECSPEHIVVSEIPQEGSAAGLARLLKRCDSPDRVAELLKWVKDSKRDPKKDKFILLVRPKAVHQWDILKPGLESLGFKVGTDVWLAGRHLLGEPQGP